jgi:hypothetical protein
MTDTRGYGNDAGADDQSEAGRDRERFLARVQIRHLRTGRHKNLLKAVRRLMEQAKVAESAGEGRALFVLGETGAGKTHALSRVIRDMDEAQPVRTATTTTMPIVRVVAPSPCTLKMLGTEILLALGYPLTRELKESTAWGLVRQQLRMRGVKIVHIDEGQHMLNWRDANERQKLADTLKNVMQQPDWPVSFIVSGLPELADFLDGDRQLRRRSEKQFLSALDLAGNRELLAWITRKVVHKHAGMTLAFEITEDFLGRLHRAACGQFGIVVQVLQRAIEQAVAQDVDATVVAWDDFARAYRALAGCQPAENVFLARDWHLIEPANALLESLGHAPGNQDPEDTGRKKRKRA